jgi:hypothetical protein
MVDHFAPFLAAGTIESVENKGRGFGFVNLSNRRDAWRFMKFQRRAEKLKEETAANLRMELAKARAGQATPRPAVSQPPAAPSSPGSWWCNACCKKNFKSQIACFNRRDGCTQKRKDNDDLFVVADWDCAACGLTNHYGSKAKCQCGQTQCVQAWERSERGSGASVGAERAERSECASEASASETSASETSASETSASETSASETSASETSARAKERKERAALSLLGSRVAAGLARRCWARASLLGSRVAAGIARRCWARASLLGSR